MSTSEETKFIRAVPSAIDENDRYHFNSPEAFNQQRTGVLFDIADKFQVIAGRSSITSLEFKQFLVQYKEDQGKYFGLRHFGEFHEVVRHGLMQPEEAIRKANNRGETVTVIEINDDIKATFSAAARSLKENLLA